MIALAGIEAYEHAASTAVESFAFTWSLLCFQLRLNWPKYEHFSLALALACGVQFFSVHFSGIALASL